MTLESADIQDSDIMAMTTQSANDKGKMQFVAKLPLGGELTSEWFDPGRKRDALMAWLPAVRSAMLAADEEQRLAAKKAAALATKPPDMIGRQIVSSDAHVGAGMGTMALGSGELDRMEPLAYVQLQRDDAATRTAVWTGNALRATAELERAKADLAKWEQILLSIGGMISADSTTRDRNTFAGACAGYDGPGRNGNAVPAEWQPSI